MRFGLLGRLQNEYLMDMFSSIKVSRLYYIRQHVHNLIPTTPSCNHDHISPHTKPIYRNPPHNPLYAPDFYGSTTSSQRHLLRNILHILCAHSPCNSEIQNFLCSANSLQSKAVAAYSTSTAMAGPIFTVPFVFLFSELSALERQSQIRALVSRAIAHWVSN